MCDVRLFVGDVLQLGSCDMQPDDGWRLYSKLEIGGLWGFEQGRNKQFMACWDTGVGWRGPYNADGQPLRKKPFQEDKSRKMGCLWKKV